ncbi:hypothetical protein GJ496_002935 [Pomphorhynchus laevis]|nr:hypothetical protein GJ496_002935 [Pomphorhynchus laevis]
MSEDVKQNINDQQTATRNLTRLTVINTVFQFVIQISLKAITFLVNSYLIRNVDMRVIAISNVRLALLHSSIVGLGRDAFRRTVPKGLNSFKSGQLVYTDYRTFVQLCYPVSVTLYIALTTAWMWTSPTELKLDYIRLATLIYSTSALIELLSEPTNLIMNAQLRFKEQMVLEAVGSFIHCAVQFILVAFKLGDPLMAYAYAQLLNSIFIFIGTMFAEPAEIRMICRMTTLDMPQLNNPMVRRWIGYYKHTFAKQFLTQFENYAITFLHMCPSLEDQATFETINRLGSSIARIALSPIEQNSYTLYSKLGQDAVDQQQSKYQIRKHLTTVLRIVLTASICALTITIPYAPYFTKAYGLQSVMAANLLRLFNIYIVLLAWNGMTECLLQATASPERLTAHRNFLFLCSILSAICLILLSRLFKMHVGPQCLLIFNCLNMLIRCVYNQLYCSRWLMISDFMLLKEIAPNAMILLVCYPICLAINCNQQTEFLKGVFTSVAILVPLIIYTERCLIADLYKYISNQVFQMIRI